MTKFLIASAAALAAFLWASSASAQCPTSSSAFGCGASARVGLFSGRSAFFAPPSSMLNVTRARSAASAAVTAGPRKVKAVAVVQTGRRAPVRNVLAKVRAFGCR